MQTRRGKMIEDTNKNEQLVKDKKEDGKATPTVL